MGQSRWEDARRLEAWAGETRVNLIRSIALVVFYANHLLSVYVYGDVPSGGGRFHAAVTAVVLAWAIGILVLHTCLTRRWVPDALKYIVTFWDLLLVTTLVMASPEGPRSTLMLLYFVVLAAAPLRLSLPLVVTTTLASMASALIVLGQYVFIRIGSAEYYRQGNNDRIPRVSEILFLLALGAVGLLAGQVVRQARRLVDGYPVRVQDEQEAA
jgi:hypothetical protein